MLCAIWIPELGVGNAIYMEPVDGVESIPKNRWKLVSVSFVDDADSARYAPFAETNPGRVYNATIRAALPLFTSLAPVKLGFS